jgi:hypothetical protein
LTRAKIDIHRISKKEIAIKIGDPPSLICEKRTIRRVGFGPMINGKYRALILIMSLQISQDEYTLYPANIF